MKYPLRYHYYSHSKFSDILIKECNIRLIDSACQFICYIGSDFSQLFVPCAKKQLGGSYVQ